MATLFVSDLHLDATRPAVTRTFLEFLQREAVNAQALYILGDLFEAWIGDDDDGVPGSQVATALRALTAGGIPAYFMHGNRDFLVGKRFAQRAGIQLLPEARVIDLYGTPTLIMHGDTLCSDDIPYQALRSQVRAPQWQAQILALPLDQRREMATKLRLDSQQAVQQKPEDIMDVNQETVHGTMRTHHVSRLIHGHTHRPAIHDFALDGRPAQRIVLGAWYRQGSVLSWDTTGCQQWTLELI